MVNHETKIPVFELFMVKPPKFQATDISNCRSSLDLGWWSMVFAPTDSEWLSNSAMYFTRKWWEIIRWSQFISDVLRWCGNKQVGELEMIEEKHHWNLMAITLFTGQSQATHQPEWQSQDILGLGLTPQSADAGLELFDLQPGQTGHLWRCNRDLRWPADLRFRHCPFCSSWGARKHRNQQKTTCHVLKSPNFRICPLWWSHLFKSISMVDLPLSPPKLPLLQVAWHFHNVVPKKKRYVNWFINPINYRYIMIYHL